MIQVYQSPLLEICVNSTVFHMTHHNQQILKKKTLYIFIFAHSLSGI